ncbi:hypothetical protein GY15_29125 [Delftia sp. 670]|nr:hypothetical protein GY15_29125 [Delftia sp. 670]
MRNLDELLGDSGMRLMVRAEMVTATAGYTVVDDGWAILTGMGGGAGGSRSAAPGNSAPWGVKMVAVRAGDVIDFVIGAGGGVASADGSPAPAGGTTLVRQNGATLMTCQGGDAGPASPTARSPVAATVAGADFWLRGRQPMGGGVAPMAGAAVDLGGKTYNLNTSTGTTPWRWPVAWMASPVAPTSGPGISPCSVARLATRAWAPPTIRPCLACSRAEAAAPTRPPKAPQAVAPRRAGETPEPAMGAMAWVTSDFSNDWYSHADH